MRTSDGVDLALTSHGPDGAPVVLAVHGYPDDHTVWDAVVPLLTPDFRVVTYDVRGAGASTAPDSREGYRIERLGADLREVVEAVSPGAPVHLLAHDWGSVQAWQAVTEPDAAERFASYTSISGPCLQHLRAFYGRASRGARIRQTLASWYIGFFQLATVPELTWRTGIFGGVLARREGIPRPVVRDAVNGLELYRANAHGVRGKRRTDVPVQVVAPTGDRFVTPALAASAREWCTDFRFREVPGGHWLPRARPDVVARCVREHIAAAQPATTAHTTAPDTAATTAAPATGTAAAATTNPSPLLAAATGTPTPTEPLALRRTRSTGWNDRIVLVTGAGSGIGRAVAQGFARRGAHVVAVDRDRETAEATAFEAGGTAYQADVADPQAMEDLAERVCTELGVPDVVVNNAGIAVSGSFLDHSAQDWQDIVDVNLMGVVHGCRLFGARMKERGEGGHIVNVASAAAFTPVAILPAYCTTKAAVLMLSECLRAELAPEGIGVTTLCPGFLPTNIGASARFVGTDDPAGQQRRTDRLLKRRPYSLDKVADAVIRAVEQNKPVQLLTAESRIARLTPPPLLRRVARLPLLNG